MLDSSQVQNMATTPRSIQFVRGCGGRKLYMTWEELKIFCNSLSENSLKENVILFREDTVIGDISSLQLEEDYYIEEDGAVDGCIPLCEVKSLIKDNKDEYPRGKGHFIKVYCKGHPLLQENF